MSELAGNKVACPVCPHRCVISEGGTGRCRARGTRNGKNVSLNYGIVSSIALDPIEKKPLQRFFPGSSILSVGSFGCNLNCPFCQNWEKSMADCREFAGDDNGTASESYIAPDILAEAADKLRNRGNIGVAFTYNEPLIGYEYALDTAKLLRKMGLKTILVTNGCVNEEIAKQILAYTDALNIDLKSFRPEIYGDMLGGDLKAVQRFIELAVERCHVELTTLIVPGMNDSEAEMRDLSGWIASLTNGEDIPLHVTRFFPRYRMSGADPTERDTVLRLAAVAQEKLKYVYPGNI